MASAYGIALLLACVAAAVADEPKPCCPPKQFVIRIDEVTVSVDKGVVVTKLQRVDKAYDATNKLLTDILTAYNAETGEVEHTKTINLFPQGAKYVIKDGVCTKEALTHEFLELCVPEGATYYETSAIGLGEYVVNGFKLSLPQEGYNLEYRFGFGKEKCIPFQFEVQKIKSGIPLAGRVTPPLPLTSPFNETWSGAASVTPLSTSAQYRDYEEGIKDPNFWFKPPPECKKAGKRQEVAAKKMAEKLRNMFSGDRKFSVY